MNQSFKTSIVRQPTSTAMVFSPLPGSKKTFPNIKSVIDNRMPGKFLKKIAAPVRPPTTNVATLPRWNTNTAVDRNIKPLPGKKETLETLRRTFRARPMPNFNKAANPSVAVVDVKKKGKVDMSWLGVELLQEEENYRLEDELEPDFEEEDLKNIPLPTSHHQNTNKAHHHNSSAISSCFNWTASPAINKTRSGKGIVRGLRTNTPIRPAIWKW